MKDRKENADVDVAEAKVGRECDKTGEWINKIPSVKYATDLNRLTTTTTRKNKIKEKKLFVFLHRRPNKKKNNILNWAVLFWI